MRFNARRAPRRYLYIQSLLREHGSQLMAVQSFVLDRTVFQMMVAQPSVAGVPFLSQVCQCQGCQDVPGPTLPYGGRNVMSVWKND